MVENLPRIGDEGFGIAVTEIEKDRGDDEGAERRGGNLLIVYLYNKTTGYAGGSPYGFSPR